MDFEDLEIDDYDAELLCQEDYEAVLKLRRNQLHKYPNKYHTRYKWAEILVITKHYDDALKVLSKLHNEDDEDGDTNILIIESLREQGKKPEDFNWMKMPKITILDEELISIISAYIKGKRKDNRGIDSIYNHILIKREYPFFNQEELFNYLKRMERVKINGDVWYDSWV